MARRSNRESAFSRRGPLLSRRRVLAGGAAAAGAAALGFSFWGWAGGQARHAYALAPESALPPDIQRASSEIRPTPPVP